MENTNKIPVAVFDKIVKDTTTSTETVKWNDIDIVVKKTLSFKEMMTFVNSVTKSCFDVDDGTYLPEVKDFIIQSNILDMYTNFTIPEDADQMYELIYCTDVIPAITQHVNRRQLNEIIQAINDKVDNLAQANIEMINRQMNDLYTAFNNLQEQLSAAFSGIGVDDITKLVGAISDGKFDESKLVQEYINQTKREATQKDGDE